MHPHYLKSELIYHAGSDNEAAPFATNLILCFKIHCDVFCNIIVGTTSDIKTNFSI